MFCRSLRCIYLLWAVVTVEASLVQRQQPAEQTASLARNVTTFIVLGDSYSDSCNAYNGGYFANKKPADGTTFPHCPSGTKAADGGRAWPEWIRIDQHQVESNTSAPGGDPVNARQWHIYNYAQSGATCDNEVFKRAPIPDVGEQITLYQTKYKTVSPPITQIQTEPASTMACIFIGTNDLGISVGQNDSAAKEADCISRQLTKLHTLGFRQFLAIQVINLEDAPLHNTPQKHDVVARQVQDYNAMQATAFQKLTTTTWNDGSTIDIFPAYALFKAMHDKPAAYGFSNVAKGCSGCPNLDAYLWADILHPSERAFHIFARKLVRFVSQGARGQALIDGTEGL